MFDKKKKEKKENKKKKKMKPIAFSALPTELRRLSCQ